MKKRNIALIGLSIILIAVLVGCSGPISSFTGTAISKNIKNGSWTVSAKTINGNVTQTINFSSNDLATLHVKNTNSSGVVTLVLTQGETQKTFIVSGEFDESIDTSAFTPGKIIMNLNFVSARDLDVSVSWK